MIEYPVQDLVRIQCRARLVIVTVIVGKTRGNVDSTSELDLEAITNGKRYSEESNRYPGAVAFK